MKSARILTLLVAVALIVGAVAWRVGGGDGGGGATSPGGATPPADAVAVEFVYSPEKRDLLEPLITEFNASGAEAAGRPVFVTGRVVSSGSSAANIAAGTLKPQLWSPASSLWGQVVNYRADADLAPERSPSLVRTPLVIAIWEPLARALGWPQKPLGWEDVLREATSPEGWAKYGRPEWGRFKLGHTNPDFSTSGLSAVVAEYLFATGKSEGLVLADVQAPATREKVRAIEQSIVHYGDTTLFFAEQLAKNGPAYASAVAMEEVTLLDFNLKKAGTGPRLAAIYPKEGTFFSDNPLFVLDGDWSTPEQKEGAEKLSEFLRQKTTPELAARLFFRPGDPALAPGAPITAANLVDPKQPTRTLGLPDPEVLNAIQRFWREDRKPARVQIVLDISGSMNQAGKLDGAQQGLLRFLDLMQPQDEVGLTVFNGRVTPITPPLPIRTSRARLKQAVQEQIADGDTAVYDATVSAAKQIAGKAGADRISAVVVLTDGQDNASRIRPRELLAELQRLAGPEGEDVRVFTIAYGGDASTRDLEIIADAGGGKAYVGDPDTIEAVYTQIASFF